MNRVHIAAVLLAASVVSGCATVPGQDRLAERDPLEKFNRGVWGFNQGVDKVVLKPVTSVYRTVAPRPVRQGVSNAFANLTEPWSFINNLLQGKPKRAVTNLKRFVINTTIGVAGLFDQASKMGVQPANEDLGQTLAKWGVNGGPYLVLPLLGPSTLRDGVGSGAAAFADPVNIAVNQADVNVWYKRGYRAAQIISARSDLTDSGADGFLNSSLDPYAAARSAYLQRRRVQILDQEDGLEAGPADDFSAEPAAESVITPTGDATTATPAPTGELPPSEAALPGDEAAPSGPAPETTLPESSAPMPGDEPAPVSPQ
jgi:phospholipid-binding lipoprotein MlaA